jgi:ribulose-5-phosphate 4-epimerase/fuculose-1-phosphate aldolase
MKQILDKYADKLVNSGLSDEGFPLIGGLDDELIWNRKDPHTEELAKVFDKLNINSLLYSKPAEPYYSIIEYLITQAEDTIYPNDCETRTFMHDIPVIRSFNAEQIADRLKQRKSVIIEGYGIVTWGTVSPEQAFIFYSSVCFACFVKFFCDYLYSLRYGSVSIGYKKVFEKVIQKLDVFTREPLSLMQAPFHTEEEVYKAICEAGRLTVEYRLVDSFFGNVSYLYHGCLYISQTTSSLDELEGHIDPCPMDDSSCSSITASSEFIAHREIVKSPGINGVLHGHPKFSVIISMFCDKQNCELEGRCHIECNEKRFIRDIPIVPGEVGTGPTGLCNTLPPAMKNRRGVIVYGHGIFTVAKNDFNEAFANLLEIERMCKDRYFQMVAS